MYIEEYIRKISIHFGTYHILGGSHTPINERKDLELIESISYQLLRGSLLTEKQGLMILRILKKYESTLIHQFPKISQDLANPQWENKFRVLPSNKRITIEDSELYGKSIHLEFPYDEEIVQYLRQWNKQKKYNGSWDNSLKRWILTLREENILMVGDYLLPRGFQATEDFSKMNKEVDIVRNNVEHHLPMVSKTHEGFRFINCVDKIPQPNTDSLVETLYTARNYGITAWDDSVASLMQDKGFREVNRKILEYSDDNQNYTWVNSENHDITDLEDLLRYGGPILIIVPGGSEFDALKKWHEFALTVGIRREQISVMFRLPNSKAQFNIYVKDNELNNIVDASTRIVFVNIKIPKPLIKEGIRFNTVINLGYYEPMHFTMNTVLASVGNLVYYNSKEPSKLNKYGYSKDYYYR